MQTKNKYNKKTVSNSTKGFTLIELIIVVLMISILAAIATPSWVLSVNIQHLNTAQNQIYRAMQETKSKAKLEKRTWQFSLREKDKVVQWAVHPAKYEEFIPSGIHWHNLGKNIRVDKYKNDKGEYETTLDSPGNKTVTGPWKVQFKYQGNTKGGDLGRVSLTTEYTGKIKRCVIVSTLIGTIRTGREHSKSKDGKYCY
ncbi:MAG: prepilin-type N-terminal cleavage/methylation domain-containing protein [Symploca sp. SIO2E9]|nr:prepilin-type N-terminal cleavage/methylation domain-containing protein [Symploca sp. SIO2E9]